MYKKLTRTLKQNKIAVRLILITFILTIVFVSSLKFAINKTSTTDFCIGCHEMEIVYNEYKLSKHFENKKGIRATCSDCHVPNEYPDKLIAKIITGGKDVIMHIVMDQDEFNINRLNMAHNVWESMKDRNSKECKNCHSNLVDKTNHKSKEINCITCHMFLREIAHARPWRNK